MEVTPKRKIFFSFAGTGGAAEILQQNLEPLQAFDDNIVRVYFNGCQDSRIGGGNSLTGLASRYISPNLDFVAAGVRQAFKTSDNIYPELSLQALKDRFGDAIRIEPDTALTEDKYQATSISLDGFSRGAVTTFACARYLNDLDVEMSLYAEDPVPGSSRSDTERSASQYAQNFDLSKCNNLKRAVVTVGTYTKNHGGLQNKYFRQMTPNFYAKTDANIYTSPKSHHLETDINQMNQRLEFLNKQGILNTHLVFNRQNTERLYAIPKVLQQKFHLGTAGRTTTLPLYKVTIKDKLEEHNHFLKNDSSFKQGEAFLAIYSRYGTTDEIPHALNKANNDTSLKGRAVRDFIIETHAIMKFSLEKKPSILESLIKYVLGDRFEETFSDKNIVKYNEASNNYLKAVDKLLIDLTNKTKPSLDDYKAFEENVFKKLSVLKNKIPAGSYNVALASTQLYLKEAPLTHPGLTKFLDESETFSSDSIDKAKAIAHDAQAENAKQLAFKLYVSSQKERRNVFKTHASALPTLIDNVQDIADIAQLVTTKELEAMLAQKGILDNIKSVEDVCRIMEQLPSYEHRKIFFKALDVQKLNPTKEQAANLNKYLSQHKQSAFKAAMSEIRENAVDNNKKIEIGHEPLNDTRPNTPMSEGDTDFTPIDRNIP